MGKAKNNKKHRKKVGKTSEPVQLRGPDESGGQRVSELLSGLSSLHEKKRAEACMLLADLFSRRVSNSAMEKMSSSEVLSKLSMRLVDSDKSVREHAAGAIRNMATCRQQFVSRRLVSMGILGTMISLIIEELNKVKVDMCISFIEQLIAAISNLCASCDEAVNEIHTRNFCQSLLKILEVDIDSSIVRVASQCLHVISEGHLEIARSIISSPGTMQILFRVAEHASTDTFDSYMSKLYVSGAILNILTVLPEIQSTELVQKSETLIPLLMAAFDPCMEAIEMCTSPSVDDSLIVEAHNKSSTNPSAESVEFEGLGSAVAGENEKEPDVMDEGGEEVYVGGEVDKPWASSFDLAEVSAEILANMAVGIKERCTNGTEEQCGDDGIEWGDDEENEEAMDRMAALNSASNQQSLMSLVNTGSFDAKAVIGGFISVLTKLSSGLDLLIGRSEREKAAFASSSIEMISCAEKSLIALSNFLFLVDRWVEGDVITLLQLLLHLFGSFAAVFRGVTVTQGVETEGGESSSLWLLSPLIERSKLQSGVIATLAACASCLATLHHMPIEMDIFSLNSSNAHDNGIERVRGERIVSVLRGLSSIPFWEVAKHCLDIISALSNAELRPNEVKVLSNALLKRLSDPSALRTVNESIEGNANTSTSGICDASILVMEACISSFIDLHSSDDPNFYSIYISLDSPAILQQAYSDFRNKIQNEAKKIDREEVRLCKETLLNLKRFLKYKANAPSSVQQR